MNFTFSDTEQQVKQLKSNFNFCHLHQQNRSFSFVSTTAPTGSGDGFKAPTRTVIQKGAVTRNQCIFCLSEHENKSFEEIRLEDYDSNKKCSTADSGLRFKNGAHNFSFLNETHSSHGSIGMTNNIFWPMRGFFSQTQIPAGFGTPSTSTSMPFGLGRIFDASLLNQNKQCKDFALVPSHDDADHAEKLRNIPKPIFKDSKHKATVNESSNVPRSLNSILSQHLGMPSANNVKKLALDSLIALMIISKAKSIPEILNMIPGNVGLDDFKAHLICAAEELNCELLSKNVNEPVRQPAKTSKIIHINLPTGEILIRSFMADTPLSLLLTYIASQGYPDVEYKLLTTWSCQDLTALDKSQTLEDLKLHYKAYLRVEKR